MNGRDPLPPFLSRLARGAVKVMPRRPGAARLEQRRQKQRAIGERIASGARPGGGAAPDRLRPLTAGPQTPVRVSEGQETRKMGVE